MDVAAMCCQEHHAAGEKWADLQHAARKLNWAMQGSPAVPGKGHSGCSGVSIAAKRHIGMAPPDGRDSFDISPAARRGSLLRLGSTEFSEAECCSCQRTCGMWRGPLSAT